MLKNEEAIWLQRMKMTDLLVKLYDLPDVEPYIRELKNKGIVIRRVMAYEKHDLLEWVKKSFGTGWESECDVSFSNHPISSFIATEGGEIIGFACYDSTRRNFFGPTGVLESRQGMGIGKALLLSSLHSMAASGYAYSIIGGVGETDFYVKSVGAIEIPGSSPGVYRDRLKKGV